MEDQDIIDLFAAYFKDSKGNPYKIYDYQIPIARSILDNKYRKIEVNATTRAGKSLTIGLSALLYILDRPRYKVTIIAPTYDQTKIIMDYIAEHITDSPWISEMVDVDTRSSSPERLRKEVSKSRITFKNTGSVNLISAEGKGDRIIGKGANLVIEDEAELINDEIHRTKIMRMLGDSEDSKIVLIGNSLNQNHFYEASLDPDYEHIHISWRECVEEGRLTQKYIDGRREQLTPPEFKMWFESEFVEDLESKLISSKWIDRAISEIKQKPTSETRYGLDVAEMGNDWTVLTGNNFDGDMHRILDPVSWSKTETMPTVGRVISLIEKENEANVDATGIGNGVWSRLKEQNYKANKLIVGSLPTREKNRFLNLKAQLFWRLRNLFEEGKIQIPNHPRLVGELNKMKYNFTSNGKIFIIDPPKSPDFADSLVYSIYRTDQPQLSMTRARAF